MCHSWWMPLIRQAQSGIILHLSSHSSPLLSASYFIPRASHLPPPSQFSLLVLVVCGVTVNFMLPHAVFVLSWLKRSECATWPLPFTHHFSGSEVWLQSLRQCHFFWRGGGYRLFYRRLPQVVYFNSMLGKKKIYKIIPIVEEAPGCTLPPSNTKAARFRIDSHIRKVDICGSLHYFGVNVYLFPHGRKLPRYLRTHTAELRWDAQRRWPRASEEKVMVGSFVLKLKREFKGAWFRCSSVSGGHYLVLYREVFWKGALFIIQ